MRVVVVCFERLPACSLGCYGEQNIATPHFDALASQSDVFDGCLTSPDQESILTALQGQQAHVVHVPDPSHAGKPNAHARFSSFLSELPETALACIHVPSGALPLSALVSACDCWLGDLAAEFRESLLAQHGARSRSISENQLPLLLQALPLWQQRLVTHTARVLHDDEILGTLLLELDPFWRDGDWLLVTSVSGDPDALREDRPAWQASVSEPAVHVPLLILQIGACSRERFSEFVTPDDVALLVPRLMSGEPVSIAAWMAEIARPQLQYSSSQARAVRTENLLLVQHRPTEMQDLSDAAEPAVCVYRKPQDVWEAQDVAVEMPEVIEHFRKTGSLDVGNSDPKQADCNHHGAAAEDEPGHSVPAQQQQQQRSVETRAGHPSTPGN